MSEENKTQTKITITAPLIFKGNANDYGWMQVAVKEDSGEYPTTIAMDFKEDKVKECKVGDIVELTGYVNSREYNGKFYTQINGNWFKNLDAGAGFKASAKHTQQESNESPFEDDGAF